LPNKDTRGLKGADAPLTWSRGGTFQNKVLEWCHMS